MLLPVGKRSWSKKYQLYLKNYKIFDKREISDDFFKNWYFANNYLIKVQIWEFFCMHVTHITVIVFSTANFISTKLTFR